MPQLVIVRPVHILPGKKDELIRWSIETKVIRQRWGMVQQMSLRSTFDREQYLLIQVWESREAYARWKASPDRQRLLAESSRMVLNDTTQTFETIVDDY